MDVPRRDYIETVPTLDLFIPEVLYGRAHERGDEKHDYAIDGDNGKTGPTSNPEMTGADEYSQVLYENRCLT